MDILFLTNSSMPFVERVKVCIQRKHNVFDIFFTKINIISFFKGFFYAMKADIIWCEFASYPAFYGVLLGKLFKKRTIVHVHRFEVNENSIFKPLILWTIRNADKVICPSQYISNNLKSLTGIESIILYNAVPKLIKSQYILSVGALIKRKGHDRLIREFFHKYYDSDMKLIIIGKGPEKLSLEALISELNLTGRVYLVTDYMPDIVLNVLYKHCAEFALLSEDEGMSVAIIEAGVYERKLWISQIEPNKEYLSTPSDKFTIHYMEHQINELISSTN